MTRLDGLVEEIVEWLNVEHDSGGVTFVSRGTLVAEFSDGTSEGDADVDQAIDMIRTAAQVLR